MGLTARGNEVIFKNDSNPLAVRPKMALKRARTLKKDHLGQRGWPLSELSLSAPSPVCSFYTALPSSKPPNIYNKKMKKEGEGMREK